MFIITIYIYNYICICIIYRHNQLSWHDGLIPPNEIWIKLGGDKGGSSVKLSFQMVNTEIPNSVQKIIIRICNI